MPPVQEQETHIEEEVSLTTTIYSKPACVQCEATKRKAKALELDFRVIDVTEDPQALERIKSLGYLQAPVVVTDNDHWSGYRPDKLEGLVDKA